MLRLSAGRRAIDPAQFARFFVGGVVGAAANLTTVYIIRGHAAYALALGAGGAAGFVVSFAMSKLFAFRSRAMAQTRGELSRFILVYLGGIGCYLVIGLVLGRWLLPTLMARYRAEMLGAFLGTASMTVTSYFGHRFFTYRHMLGR